jgi:hypothetical protein
MSVIAVSGLPAGYLKGFQHRLREMIKLNACAMAGERRMAILWGARR